MGLNYTCKCGKNAGANETCPSCLKQDVMLKDDFLMTQDLLEYISNLIQSHEMACGYKKYLEFYKAGIKKEIPQEWRALANQFYKERDPEYKKYLNLKEKFEKDWDIFNEK